MACKLPKLKQKQMKDQKMQKLLHALGTIQLILDELYNIKNDAKMNKIDYFVRDIKQSTNNYINSLRAANVTLNQIWKYIPNEDFDDYLTAKRELLDLVQKSTFEDVKQLVYQIKDVHFKYRQLDVFEKMLKSHCTPEERNAYRAELGYTLEQYIQLKQNQELGYAPTYETLQN
jgi:hypothetical protein